MADPGDAAERPRDRLGRPLPWGTAGFPGVPPRETITTPATVAAALSYLDDELPFHAHEVCEQRWRCCPPAERAAWQALAQAAAALTHAARGNDVGAKRLADRARERLAEGVVPPGAEPLVARLLP